MHVTRSMGIPRRGTKHTTWTTQTLNLVINRMHNHNDSKMVWLMVLGCLAPLAVLTAIYLFDVPLNGILIGALILLCPLSHLFMMRFMGHSHNTMSEKPEE